MEVWMTEEEYKKFTKLPVLEKRLKKLTEAIKNMLVYVPAPIISDEKQKFSDLIKAVYHAEKILAELENEL